jgi:hypothetical protein
MARERKILGRGALPGVRERRAACGVAFDGLWNEVIVRTEASAKEHTGFDCIEDHRYGLLLSNGVLIFMCLIATMIRIYDAIRMPNVCTKP